MSSVGVGSAYLFHNLTVLKDNTAQSGTAVHMTWWLLRNTCTSTSTNRVSCHNLGLEINARKLAKYAWFLKEFASDLTSLLFEKIFLVILYKWSEKLTSAATGEIIGVESVTKYMSCYNCNKNIQPTTSLITECQNWHLKQKVAATKMLWYATVLFKNDTSSGGLPFKTACHWNKKAYLHRQ